MTEGLHPLGVRQYTFLNFSVFPVGRTAQHPIVRVLNQAKSAVITNLVVIGVFFLKATIFVLCLAVFRIEIDPANCHYPASLTVRQDKKLPTIGTFSFVIAIESNGNLSA